MDKTTFNVGDVFLALVDVALSDFTIKQGERIKIVNTETSVSYSNFDIETSKGVRSEGWGAVRFRAGPHQFFAHIPYGLFTGDLAVATLDNFYPVGTVLRVTDTEGHLVKLDAMGAKTSDGLECDGWFHEEWFTAGDACFRKLTEAEREAFEHYEKINSGVFCKANVRHVNGTWFHFDQNRILSLMLNTEQAEPAKDQAAPADVGPKFTVSEASTAIPHTITFRTSNDLPQEMLRITQDGFYVRGVKVEQGDGEANAVFEAFKAFLGSSDHAKDIRKLKQELEVMHGKLAACSVAALANTRASAEEQAIKKDSPYYSDSYSLVVSAVEREIDNRECMERMKSRLQSVRREVESLREQLRQRTAERDQAQATIEKTAGHMLRSEAWGEVCKGIAEVFHPLKDQALSVNLILGAIRSLNDMHSAQYQTIKNMMIGLDRIGDALGLGDNLGAFPEKAIEKILAELGKRKLTEEDVGKLIKEGREYYRAHKANPHPCGPHRLIHTSGWVQADLDAALTRHVAARNTLQSLGYTYSANENKWIAPAAQVDAAQELKLMVVCSTLGIGRYTPRAAAPDACDERAGFPVHHPV